MSAARPCELLALLRPMRESDLPRIASIERAAYDFPWPANIFRDCLRMGYDCTVHVVDDEPVGYLILSYGAGEAHVLNLAVDPIHQGYGYGRKLLRRVMRQIERYGADSIFLEVRPSNQTARNLYLSEGFRPVGRRPGYYPSADGEREDAVVMRWDLPKQRTE